MAVDIGFVHGVQVVAVYFKGIVSDNGGCEVDACIDVITGEGCKKKSE